MAPDPVFQPGLQAVGQIDGSRSSQPTTPTLTGAGIQQAQTTNAAPAQGSAAMEPGESVAGDQATERVILSETAERELEDKKKQEKEALQKKIDEAEYEIEQTKGKLEEAQHNHDEAAVSRLTDELHSQESNLGALMDDPTIREEQHQIDQAEQQLMPRPAGGGMMGGGMPGGGMMGGGMSGGTTMPFPSPVAGMGQSGVSQGDFALPANPSVQIPSFGNSPSKAQIGQMLDAASQKYGVPQNILKAVAWQESSWNPNALSFDGQHGKGIMQIDDRSHAFARTPEVFDPQKNIDYGTRYLSQLYKETGSWSAALKRYNGGSDYPPKVLALAEKQPWNQYA